MIYESIDLYTPKNFINYYDKFLGVDFFSKDETIIVSSYMRDYPINVDFYYPVIVSNFCNKIIFSISPRYFADLSKLCNNKVDFNSIKSILSEYFLEKKIDFEIKTMKRMTKYCDTKVDSKAILLNKNMEQCFLDSFSINITLEEKLNRWKKVKKNIENACYSCFLEKNKIVSTSFISDIICGAGNIVVFTKEGYRSNGYAKQCLIKCINWCFSNNILPIYFVNIENKNSINLAQSLGFKTVSEEIVILLRNKNN